MKKAEPQVPFVPYRSDDRAPDDALRVLDGIKNICNVRVGQIRDLGASLLVHTGPGMLAVCLRGV